MESVKLPPRKKNLQTPTFAVMVGVALALSGLFLVPSTDAGFSMDVNNVHCAHQLVSGETDEQATYSGIPFHDHTGVPPVGPPGGEGSPPQLRNSCDSISNALVGHYSVAPEPVAHLRAELYLGSDDPSEEAEGAACLEASSQDQNWETDGWECGDEQKSGPGSATNPTWFPHNLHLDLPGTGLAPERVQFKVGFHDGQDVVESPHFSRNVNHYNGPSILLGGIDDPGGGNEYLESDEFRSWTIHDPEGDDQLVIGGVPISIAPGSSFDFVEFDVSVSYKESVDHSGYEWQIVHTGDDNRVFVWDDPQADWEVHYFDW